MTSLRALPSVKLNDGTSLPAIAFGTGTALHSRDCTDLVLSALETGYVYLDTAQGYKNAYSFGEALKRWTGKREDLYIATKYGRDVKDGEQNDDPRTVLLDQLKQMGVDHVDLYLVHNPFYPAPLSLSDNWKIMEELVQEGLTRSIGVSNYRAEDILEIKKTWKIAPVLNQIEFNPYVFHADNMERLLQVCKEDQIHIESYGPLNSLFRSTGGPVDAIVERIALSKQVTSAQVLLAWAHQYTGGGPVVTTSRNEQRQQEQLDALRHEPLTQYQVDEIAQAGRGRFYRHFQKPVWDAAEA